MKPLLLGSVLLTCSDGKQQRQKKKPELPASEKRKQTLNQEDSGPRERPIRLKVGTKTERGSQP
jgi:hypothetical protein